MRLVPSAAALGAAALLLFAPAAPADVITCSADNSRAAWYSDQQFLTPASVGMPGFGRRYTANVTGQVYAQPLVANGALFIVTEDNWVYAIDADTGLQRWARQVGTPWNASDLGCGQITPRIGITGTPVIDDVSGAMYFVNMTYASGTSGPAAFYMHSLDINTGKERKGWPVQLSGTAQNAPSQTFNVTYQVQRPALLLLDGVVYAAFGSHCDIPTYQGWIFGVSTAGVVRARWTTITTTNLTGAPIWQSGGGLSSDGSGRIFFATGNGGAPTTATPGSTPPGNLGEATVRVDVQTNGTLVAHDFFAPSNAPTLDNGDTDLGSGGTIALPSAYFGTTSTPHLLMVGGKEGYFYLLNRDSLGGFRQGPSAGDASLGRYGKFGLIYGRGAAWPGDGGYVYLLPSNDRLRAFKYSVVGGAPTFTAAGTSASSFGNVPGSPIVTSNGTTSGSALVWHVGGDGKLYAFDVIPSASTLTQRYSSSIGTPTKFAPPGAGRNLIFVGTADGHALAYGAPAVALTVTKDNAAGTVNLSWSGGIAPYSLRRAPDARFKTGVVTLVDRQVQTSFSDTVLHDGNNYFYLVN